MKLYYVRRSVAEKLKAGVHVDPELFPEASIYFSDIVSFTTLAGESTPMQVVTMLNDLYLMFDTTLAKFNVYKVSPGDSVNLTSGYATWFTAGGAIRIAHYDVIDDVIIWKL